MQTTGAMTTEATGLAMTILIVVRCEAVTLPGTTIVMGEIRTGIGGEAVVMEIEGEDLEIWREAIAG